MGVLRLQLPTDPRWVNIVEKNIEEILTDHGMVRAKSSNKCYYNYYQQPEHQDLVQD
jgi:tRNA-(ms[2]io[6]A)-hydroxylase